MVFLKCMKCEITNSTVSGFFKCFQCGYIICSRCNPMSTNKCPHCGSLELKRIS
jgi:ribosomal protein L40E